VSAATSSVRLSHAGITTVTGVLGRTTFNGGGSSSTSAMHVNAAKYAGM
jgi:hypothetical protein